MRNSQAKGGTSLENNELRDDNAFSRAKDSQIQLVVNSQGDDEDTIDLGRVFHNMKLKSRLFAWGLILCMMVGICAPLLLYQFTKAPLTVASVVTLDYEVVSRDSRTGVVRSRRQVTDLTAPDDTPLDLEQVTSSYVLQNALSGLTLSQPITLSNLRGISVYYIRNRRPFQEQRPDYFLFPPAGRGARRGEIRPKYVKPVDNLRALC